MINKNLKRAVLLAGAVCVTAAAGAGENNENDKQGILYLPEDVANPLWVPERQRLQQEAAQGYQVFHEFRFEDRVVDSGITFEHEIVADAGKAYKAVHYDHGNGVAAADVDGDGLTDLFFVSQLGSNGLFRNKGDGTFEDITEIAGVAISDVVGVAAAFADIDNDGDPDLFLSTVREGNRLLENDGSGKFRDISSAAGVTHKRHSSGAVFFDYDRDGLLDLFVTNVGVYTTDEKGPGDYWIGYPDAFSGQLKPERFETSVLYHNAGGNRFEDVTEAMGLLDNSWSGDASPIDANEDGWPDLYLLNMQGHDEYYENNQGKGFVKKSRELFPATPWGAMGITVFDYNNDGHMDIYLTDMHTDMVQVLDWKDEKNKMPSHYPLDFLATDGNHVMGNALFRANGDGTFTEVSEDTGAENFWPWGLSYGDFNADGFQDVFIASSMNYPWRYGINSLLLNENGKRFRDAEYVLGIEPRRDGRTAKPWFDLDCDGADAEHRGCEAWIGGTRLGKYKVYGAYGSRSSVVLDVDSDGDLDMVTNEFNAEPMVLISNLSGRTQVKFLTVKLEGTQSNRSGIGARVTIRAGNNSYTQVNHGKNGYLAQNDMPLYFGLGGAQTVDAVEVTWPSGQRQTVTDNIGINSHLTIREE